MRSDWPVSPRHSLRDYCQLPIHRNKLYLHPSLNCCPQCLTFPDVGAAWACHLSPLLRPPESQPLSPPSPSLTMSSDPSEATPLLDSSAAQPTSPGSIHAGEASSTADSNSLSRHELAAWIIDETMRGAPIENTSAIPRTRTSRKAYLFFENTLFIRQFAALGLVFLSFFELPSYCSATRQCLAPDESELFLSSLPYLQPGVQAAINAVLLAILIFFVVFDAVALPTAALQSKDRHLYVVLTLLVADCIWVALWRGYPPIRFAPYLRALLPLFYWHALRECTIGISAVLQPFLDVVTIVALFVLVFGWLVTLLFHDVPEGDRYFGNLTVGLYSAFTSMTTADWPMQIMAVLDVSRASAILFLVFIVLGVFLLFNVLLAVVYNAYTGHIEELVITKLRSRRESIGIAFDVLVDEDGSVRLPDVRLMFDELRKNKALSEFDDQRVDFVFTALDDDRDENLSRVEFLDMVEVLQLKFIVELEDLSLVQRFFPTFFETDLWQNVSSYVRSPAFAYHIGVVMIVNIAVVLWETTMDLRNKDTPESVRLFALVECGFSLFYIVEMVLKVGSQGFNRYWRDLGNRFDFAVTWLLLLGAGYVLYPYSKNDPDIVRYLILLRCLRLFALMADIPRFRRLVQVFSILIPASVPLFSFFFLSLYVFAAAGVELFGGLIYASNPAMDPVNNDLVDAYVSNDYWALNFNDMASGWYTLFSSVIVGYLTEVAEAVASTSSFGNWTKWFFILSFIMNSLIVSNCVVAFVVDLFIMEDEEDSSEILIDMESRYGSKRVKVLQQKSTADQVYASMFRERVQEILGSGSAETQA